MTPEISGGHAITDNNHLKIMPESLIHPTAIVSPNAKLAEGVTVGPYSIIHDHVEIGANCEIGPHVVIHDYVRMGAGNRLHAHALIGDLPQDISFDSATETWVEIGDANTLREGFTIHRSTTPGNPTKMGSNGYMMAFSHIGHDCTLGDGVILTHNSGLAGHVEVGDNAVLGGNSSVHQFVRIGRKAMVGGFVGIRKDVLPFSMITGNPARHYRLNTIGLRRAGIKGDRYKTLEQAYRAVAGGNKSLDGIEETDEVLYLREWLAQKSKRGLSGFLSDKK